MTAALARCPYMDKVTFAVFWAVNSEKVYLTVVASMLEMTACSVNTASPEHDAAFLYTPSLALNSVDSGFVFKQQVSPTSRIPESGPYGLATAHERRNHLNSRNFAYC